MIIKKYFFMLIFENECYFIWIDLKKIVKYGKIAITKGWGYEKVKTV